jgi:hypothetical protein
VWSHQTTLEPPSSAPYTEPPLLTVQDVNPVGSRPSGQSTLALPLRSVPPNLPSLPLGDDDNSRLGVTASSEPKPSHPAADAPSVSARAKKAPQPPPTMENDFGADLAAELFAQLSLDDGSASRRTRPRQAPAPCDPPKEPGAAPPAASPSATPIFDQLHFSDEQVRRFESGLCDEERDCFWAGTRLPDPDKSSIRQDLLDTLSPQERADRGLYFPDEPPLEDTPPRTRDRVHAELKADMSSSTFRPPPGLQAILMVLWYVCDPLWLDFTARNIRDGFNLACSAESSSQRAAGDRPRNMINTDDPNQRELLNKALDKEIKRGNSTAFTSKPLFRNFRLVPCGVVPKKDEEVWRFIKNYSHCLAELLSINEQSPKARPGWCRLEEVVALFAQALLGFASSWDVQNAYPWFKIRSVDRHLTVTHVPGRGYSHRMRGDMGNARTGFIWEISGGRTISTLYFVMSFFTTVDDEGNITFQVPFFPDQFKKQASNVDPSRPPSPRGFGDVSHEHMLTDTARELFASQEYAQRLSRPEAVDLTKTARWVDDWINFCPDFAKGRRNDLALIVWHMLFGFPLAADKFMATGAAREFFGITFNAQEGTMHFSEAKMAKLEKLISEFLDHPNQRRSRQAWARLQGYLCFFARLFPAMRPFTAATGTQLRKAQFVERTTARVGKSTPTTAPDEETLCSLRCWRRFVHLSPRTIVPDLIPDNEAAAQATVIVHTDWSGSPAPGRLGFVVLSHGLYAYGPMLPAYYEPVKPDAKAAASAVGEATAVIAFLNSCAEIVRDAYIVVFTDSEALYKRYHNGKPRHGSVALDRRMQDLALTLTSLNARLCIYLVPGTECLADPLTRSPAQDLPKFTKRLTERMPSIKWSQTQMSLKTTPISQD